MTTDSLHPGFTREPVNLEVFGFVPALAVSVGADGGVAIVWRCRPTLRRDGMVYAALRDDGLALVTGAVRGNLWERWHRILCVISGEGGWQLGPHGDEIDPRSWAETVQGRRFQVWARKSLFSKGVSLLDRDATALAGLLKPGIGTSASQQHADNLHWPPKMRRV